MLVWAAASIPPRPHCHSVARQRVWKRAPAQVPSRDRAQSFPLSLSSRRFSLYLGPSSTPRVSIFISRRLACLRWTTFARACLRSGHTNKALWRNSQVSERVVTQVEQGYHDGVGKQLRSCQRHQRAGSQGAFPLWHKTSARDYRISLIC